MEEEDLAAEHEAGIEGIGFQEESGGDEGDSHGRSPRHRQDFVALMEDVITFAEMNDRDDEDVKIDEAVIEVAEGSEIPQVRDVHGPKESRLVKVEADEHPGDENGDAHPGDEGGKNDS